MVGDFNSLNTSDYSVKELESIKATRRKNNWEDVKVDVMGLTGGWVDCYTEAQRTAFRGPLHTSRFHTRIDYVFLNEELADMVQVVEYEHVESDVSDHNMVVCTLRMTVC